MAHIKNALFVVALCLLAGALAELGTTNDGDIQKSNDPGDLSDSYIKKLCEGRPFYNCMDCQTRLFCWEDGGNIVKCYNPFAPYCVNGSCSDVPDKGCAKV
ncbi:unnamed protein product [Chrysodeixis includens]|uniref:Uncharacterized protein n=1 Tax=Chrysodeixis includens TaxID=689277 RepID=A0A9P0BQF7_CHRIL|nr:unnamed protein product [Chrysodeixis includens]